MTYLRSVRAALAAALTTAVAFQPATSLACTSFVLKAKNGDVVYGRTMEFALPLHSQLIVVPRNLAVTAVGPDGKSGTGLAYTTRYGATGANGLAFRSLSTASTKRAWPPACCSSPVSPNSRT